METDKVAWGLAQQCRSIVQGCLREEEWQDADHAFYGVIKESLTVWAKGGVGAKPR
jgi:hypothetical protein